MVVANSWQIMTSYQFYHMAKKKFTLRHLVLAHRMLMLGLTLRKDLLPKMNLEPLPSERRNVITNISLYKSTQSDATELELGISVRAQKD